MNTLLTYAIVLAQLLNVDGACHAVAGGAGMPQDSLGIGLLVQDKSHSSVILAAQQAIDKANHSGVYGDRPFKLIVRTTDGFWGAGSKESVNLVYEDQVRAMLGSLDGRNAHLAEQVAAKSHLVYLETRATDPTLSQAYVPWFFRTVPNDEQQSIALLDEIGTWDSTSVVILSRDQYDTRYAVKSLTKLAAREHRAPLLVLHQAPPETQQIDLLNQLKQSRTKHLVIPYYSSHALELIALVKKEIPQIQLYGTLAFSAGLKKSDLNKKELQGMKLIFSFASEPDLEQKEDLYAMYTYEASILILQAISEAGSDREAIKDHLFTVDISKSVGGPIRFDQMGNRTGKLPIVRINGGTLKPVD